ncbi:MAG: response regulator [Anaerovoracaceae bacterium]
MINNKRELKELKILYVEDEKDTRDALAAILRRRVGKFFVAEDGEEGLELFRLYKPDMVIADLFMPKMDGVEMVRTIRSEGFKPLVVITSAIGDSEVILKAVDAGIDKYIIKPIDPEHLLEELSSLAQLIAPRATQENIVLPENKKELEATLKKEFAAFMKEATGKGPRDVKVFIREDGVEITAIGVLTPLEKSILDNIQNIAIIEQNRRLFFSVKAETLCRLVAEYLNISVEVAETNIDIAADTNQLVFHWKR